MPRLRAAKTSEEAALVPETEPVQIVLEGAPEVVSDEQELEVDTTKKPPAPEKKVETRAAPEPEAEDPEPVQPDIGALQKQLEDLKRAEQSAQEALVIERQRAAESQKREQEFIQRDRRNQEEVTQAQYDAILNAIEASRAEAETAQRDLEAADQAGDSKLKGDAYRRLARAEANQARLEDGKIAIESRREAEKTAPKVEPPAPPPAAPALPAAAQAWLKEHPEYLNDPTKNRQIQAAHRFVDEVQNIPLWTPEYFEKIETHLGIRKTAPKTDDADDADARPTRRTVVTQAPPTRESVSVTTGKPQSTKVTLSPQQREAARIAGVDEVTYARNVQRLEQLKREGHYQER